VSQRASGVLLVASRAGLEVLDANWQPHRTLTRPLRRMLALGGNKVLLTRQDHTLELVEYH
jgi:hypothetical protein